MKDPPLIVGNGGLKRELVFHQEDNTIQSLTLSLSGHVLKHEVVSHQGGLLRDRLLL